MKSKQILTTAAFLGMLSVALGAFAAHGLKNILSAYSLGVFETAVKYQFYHCFALLFTGLLAKDKMTAALQWAGILFMAGIIVFSGSLYLLAFLTEYSWLGMITPLGGLSFIAGWCALIIHFRQA